MRSKNMFISVYSIAKNEEANAKRWYDCFKEADEVCVLVNDTTDNTAKILKSLGAKVKVRNYKHFMFDVARNEAMRLCSKKADLLFGCDMDDTVEIGWRKKIEKAWEFGVKTGQKPNAILFTYCVRYNSSPTGIQKFIRHSIHTPDGWYWKDRVHEILEHKDHKNFIYYPKFEMTSTYSIRNHGMYLGLLEEMVREKDCEPRPVHLLAREYLLNRRYKDAIDMFNRYLSMPDATWNCERAASMKFISDCYYALGDQVQQELWLWKAMAEDPLDRDAPYILGKNLIVKREYSIAVSVLKKCLSIKEPQLDFPYFNLEAWGERPWFCLAEALFYVGKWDEADNAIAEGLRINPTNSLGLQLKEDMERNRKVGNPHKPPVIIPRYRIEIPELFQ